MISSEQLEAIVKRISQDKHSKADIDSLQQLLATGEQIDLLQLGKYNINIGQGQDIQIGDRNYIEWNEDAIQSLIEIVQGQLPQIVGIPENLPRSGAIQFVGREKNLETLHQQLQETNSPAAITGMGGVGKTELALQYALKYKQYFTGGICWLQARGVDIGTQIVQFARSRLQLNPSEELEPEAQVGFCWTHWPSGEVLIIIDDIVDYNTIKLFLPPTDHRFHVLMTTRLQLGKSITQIEIEALDEICSLKLLESLVTKERLDEELEATKNICTWLGYLPLGLELVGRYLDRKPDLSILEMEERLKKKGLKQQSLKKTYADATTSMGVASAFDLSWDTLDEPTKLLSCLLSLFAPAPIPWKLVENTMPVEDPDDLEEMRDENLIGLHLLQRKGKGVYQLHQLIREFLYEKQPDFDDFDEQRQSFCNAIILAAQQIPESPTRQLLLTISSTMPHIGEAAESLTSFFDDENMVVPFEALSRFYENQGVPAQAEVWAQQGLLKTKERLGYEHVETARSLNNLGGIYQAQGRYDEAETSFHQALDLRKQLLGNEHPDVADSLNSLAVLNCKQGQYEDAERCLNEALHIWRQSYGDEHSHIADGLNNLGMLYNDQGKYDEAEPIFINALDMRKRLLGSDHPRVITSLNNLGYCYNAKEEYEAAEQLFSEALETAQRILGDTHPRIGEYQNNLGNVYLSLEKYQEAEPLLRDALELQKKILGEEHPNVAMGLHNLAYLYYLQSKYPESEPIYLKSLEMRKRLLGESHPLVAISLNNLATLYREQEMFSQAQSLYIQAIEILDEKLGSNHPVTIQIRENLDKVSTL